MDRTPPFSLNHTSHDPLIGAVIPVSTHLTARIERALDQGGIGVVYAARSLETGTSIAVKVLQARFAGDAGIVARFAREIAFARRIHHPNVVAFLGAGTVADGRPFLAMELLEGQTLGAMVRRGGPLELSRALKLADQVLDALDAVHRAGVVHRDLSPDNVFVATSDGEGREERAVLLDFGFAQEPGLDAGDGVTPDSPGSLVGTLRFMAPEQATRGRAITAQSDLFAAALLFYYACSGALPFRGQDDLDVLVSVVRAAPVPLRRRLRAAPPALDEVLGRAFEKHPDARFSSAGEMRAALATVTPKPVSAKARPVVSAQPAAACRAA